MQCSDQEEGYSLLAALSPLLFVVYAVLPIGVIIYTLYGSRRDLGVEEQLCCGYCWHVQWGGAEDEIASKRNELSGILSGIREQMHSSAAGSEAGSMIRRAAEGRIKRCRRDLAKLERDEHLFGHTVFQERYGWAFAKYVDSKYYWEIVVLVRKMAVGVVVSFLTVQPLVSVPLQLIVIVVALYLQLRWRPYIAVKGRCGVCGTKKRRCCGFESKWVRNISAMCCQGANNRIEIVLMLAECLLLVAGFANAAVADGGALSNMNMNNMTNSSNWNTNGTAAAAAAARRLSNNATASDVVLRQSTIPLFEWLGSLLFLIGITMVMYEMVLWLTVAWQDRQKRLRGEEEDVLVKDQTYVFNIFQKTYIHLHNVF